ncbi:MAG: carbohydrate-binding protein [Clostridia bacterium]|nr:carbohydrate-binding protein [Clostridia bacterium]
MEFFKSISKNNQTGGKTNCSIQSSTSEENNTISEYSLDFFDDTERSNAYICSTNGVQLYDIQNMIKLTYTGQLAKNGADQVYAVIGYGEPNHWENVETLLMNKTAQQSFEVLTFRKAQGNINVAFKDSANNWDNNQNQNYVFYKDINIH